MVCHPELVHQVLTDTRTFDKGGPQYDRLRSVMGDGVVTCRHGEHRRRRSLLQPSFRPSRAAASTGLMAEEARAACRDWRPGRKVDIAGAMVTLSTQVASRLLFSDSLDAAKVAELRDCLTVVARGLFVRTVVPVDALFRVPTPGNRRYLRAVDGLHAIIDSAVAERRRGVARDDLLGVLLEAARGDGGAAAISEQEIHDQLITILLTGVDPTALCLTSAFSLLAQHPDVERRLHAEVDTVLDGRLPGPDDVPRLVHTGRVITETLRHSPPGWLFTRITTQETELAGHRLPRGTTVLYSPYLLHHDPASFPDPDLFLPDRWLPERAAAVPAGAWLPFAAGRRTCLGNAVARQEAVVALATIAGRWRLRHPAGPVAPPRPAATLGHRALTMICEPRSHGGGDNGVTNT
ncbi:cytochrome P450 [Streptomyces sp. S.PNR 29]|nr:cytochrome P450 [Streptomyces sp. S.PNR 29]